jgi:hypothetical protein
MGSVPPPLKSSHNVREIPVELLLFGAWGIDSVKSCPLSIHQVVVRRLSADFQNSRLVSALVEITGVPLSDLGAYRKRTILSDHPIVVGHKTL